MRRARWLLAALAVTAAGCGGPAEHGTATNALHDRAVKFAECMRDHGVADFPDPDASGALTVDAVANGSSVDTSGPVWSTALGACKQLEPPGFTGTTRNAQQQEHALAFARCIRSNGVPDFPDPTPGQPLVDTRRIPSANREGGMAILNAAMRTCRAAAAAAGATGP